MITIINGKQDGFIGEGFVYVGRPMKRHENLFVRCGSVLGNLFKARSKSEAVRREVVGQFRNWLRDQVKQRNPGGCKELERLKGLAQRGDLKLVCWCGTVCHAEVIKDAIERAIESSFSFWSEGAIAVGDLVEVEGKTMAHTARVMEMEGEYIQVDGETIAGWVKIKQLLRFGQMDQVTIDDILPQSVVKVIHHRLSHKAFDLNGLC
ncbi:MAG: hypothetical protein Kow00121_30290 [Elainellaceae cyanobacterium]